MIVCPRCGSKNIEDHFEFGLPLWYRFRCLDCNFLFGRLGSVIIHKGY